MRIGMNPARHKVTDYRPARVTVAVLVYIPYQYGYFARRFDVLRLCFNTLLRHTPEPHDLLVFDNNSCEAVKEFLRDLQERGLIRYLITSSENIGKLGALRIIAGAAPGEVIAYTDDDTFFYPGWLSAHLKILDAFPNVGMVSGCPERTLFDHGIESNLRLAEADPEVRLSRGQTIPEQWEREWAVALGRDVEAFLAQVRQMEDILLERNGVRAYATACHNQFLAPKAVLQEALAGPWTGRLMGGMNELDNTIDAAGYLRLCTPERTTRLIGNVVAEAMVEEARRLGVPVEGEVWRPQTVPARRPRFVWLLRWRPVRWFLGGLYNRLFWLLSGQSGGWLTEEGRHQGRAAQTPAPNLERRGT